MSKDHNRVSNEDHEIDYVAKKFNVSRSQVMLAKETVGDSRYEIYKFLRKQTAKPNDTQEEEGTTGTDLP